MMILEYVENVINSANQERDNSFYSRHKNKIIGAVGAGVGAAGAYLLHKHFNQAAPTSIPETSPPPSVLDNIKSPFTKVSHSIQRGLSEMSRPVHTSELSQIDRLSKISNLEQYKSLHGHELNTYEYDNLKRQLAELHKYSDKQ
jgi:hypothetical protein